MAAKREHIFLIFTKVLYKLGMGSKAGEEDDKAPSFTD